MNWVKCSDRLPANKTYLIINDIVLGVALGYYEDKIFTFFFYGNECNAEAENVSHWMLLPDEPIKTI